MPPLDPAPELADDVGADVVLPEPPEPPPPAMAFPVLDAELDGLEEDSWVLEAAEDERLAREEEEVLDVEEARVLEV